MTDSRYEEMTKATNTVFDILEKLAAHDIHFTKVDTYVTTISIILNHEKQHSGLITRDSFVKIMKRLRRLIELNEVIAPLLGVYDGGFITEFIDSCTSILMEEMNDNDPEFKDEYLILDSLYIDDYYDQDDTKRYHHVYDVLYERSY